MRPPLILSYCLFILIACSSETEAVSCKKRKAYVPDKYSNIPETYIRKSGIELITCGPRGGEYLNSSGKPTSYRIFRIVLVNDTVFPAELNLGFNDSSANFVLKSSEHISVFLFPQQMVPDSILNTFNFGINGLEPFLDKSEYNTPPLKTTLQPGDEKIFCMGVIMTGLARATMHFGNPNASSAKDSRAVAGTGDKPQKLNLFFELNINPPYHQSIIPCGDVVLKK